MSIIFVSTVNSINLKIAHREAIWSKAAAAVGRENNRIPKNIRFAIQQSLKKLFIE